MNDRIQQAICSLREVLKQECSASVASVEIFISDHEVSYTTNSRSPHSLKKDGISMRNIKGDWIE